MPGRSIKVQQNLLGAGSCHEVPTFTGSSTQFHFGPNPTLKTRSSQLHSTLRSSERTDQLQEEVPQSMAWPMTHRGFAAVSPWADYWTIHRVSVGDCGESQLCIITHRIHVWYICANIWGILMVNVTIYSSTMDPMATTGKSWTLQKVELDVWRWLGQKNSSFVWPEKKHAGSLRLTCVTQC